MPISNPANLVVFRSGMPPLTGWLASFALPSVLSIASTYFVPRWYFRGELTGTFEAAADEAGCERERLSGIGRLLLGGIISIAVVLLSASAMNSDLGLPTCLAALIMTVTVSVKSRTNPIAIAREISWNILPLVGPLHSC